MIEAICYLRNVMKWCCIMSYPRI